jgi:hypothetical protein
MMAIGFLFVVSGANRSMLQLGAGGGGGCVSFAAQPRIGVEILTNALMVGSRQFDQE